LLEIIFPLTLLVIVATVLPLPHGLLWQTYGTY